MSLFKKLFGQKDSAPLDPAAEPFDAEWYQALTRFGIVTGLGSFNLSLKHPQTQEPMTPHEGLNSTFAEWKEIAAPYDRRRLFFELIFEMAQESMNVWQAANYLSAVRRPDEALSLLEEYEPPQPEESDYADQCAAYAAATLGLTQYGAALSWAQKAVETAPENPHFLTLLADALHFCRQCEEAHAIYSRLMEMAPPDTSTGPADAVQGMFRSLFARETGTVSSPVVALQLAESLSDPKQSEEFWRLGEIEFYQNGVQG